MAEVGAERGVAVTTCLAGSGLDETLLARDAARVRGTQELAVAHNLVRATGDPPGLGADVGGRLRLRMYGVWGFALLASPTLRDAADVGLRYVELTYATAGIRLQETDGEARLVVDDTAVPAPLRRFVVERELAIIHTILNTIVGEPVTSIRVELRCPRPDGAERCGAVVGAPVTFGAARNAIVAPATLLDRRLPQADPHTLRLCERECRTLRARRADGRVSARVRELLMHRQCGIPGMAVAAADLHVSTRTLYRRLALEGTSYRRLVDEVRHLLAVEMLTTAGLTVEQVAVRLGYADSAAFIRAFRRWTGSTPGAYRTPPA
jgi:AraC-like DNA-binding protein